MRRLLAFLTLLLAAPAFATGAPRSVRHASLVPALDRAVAPGGAPTPPLKLPTPTRFQLSSGAKVLVVERHALPMAAVAIVWPVGAASEAPSEAGLVGLVTDLMDEGTATRGPLKLAEDLDGLGAELDVYSNWDVSGVTLTSLTRNLDGALGILADVVSAPAFDDKELERKRADHLTALLQQRDNPVQVSSDVFGGALYPGSRFGQPLGGTEAALKSLTRADVLAFHRARLGPSAATILVVGDVRPADLEPRLEKAFAAWKETGAKVSPAVAPTGTGSAHRLLVDRPGAAQTVVRVGLPSVPRNHPDYFPLVVMNTLFGGMFSSRLNMNLREAHGYAYGVGSNFAFRKQGGPFVMGGSVKTATTGPALTELYAETNRLRDQPVTPEELRLAKDLLEREMARRFETVHEVAGELAAQVVYDLPEDYLATYGAKVEAVTAADVQRVARAHIDPSRLSVVLVGDRAAIEPELAKAGLSSFQIVDADGRPLPEAKPAPSKPAAPPAAPAPAPKKK